MVKKKNNIHNFHIYKKYLHLMDNFDQHHSHLNLLKQWKGLYFDCFLLIVNHNLAYLFSMINLVHSLLEGNNFYKLQMLLKHNRKTSNPTFFHSFLPHSFSWNFTTFLKQKNCFFTRRNVHTCCYSGKDFLLNLQKVSRPLKYIEFFGDGPS